MRMSSDFIRRRIAEERRAEKLVEEVCEVYVPGFDAVKMD